MQTGDKDGLNKVYSPDGKPILNEDEEILVHEEEFVPQLRSTWGYFGGDDLINPSMGDLYLTNQRMIYIMKLEGSIQRIQRTSATTSAPQSYGVRMKSATTLQNIHEKKGTRDYFEIPIKEILACEVQSGIVSGGSQIYAYILSKGEQLHLTFVVSDDSGLLKRFKQNTVENVNELTNNLKDYFENTDWINLKEEEEEGEATETSSEN